MMLTRCPHCETTFRVTAEQLKVRHGMVRCGQCQQAFSALETLIEGHALPMDAPVPTVPAAEVAPPDPMSVSLTAEPPTIDAPAAVPAPAAEPLAAETQASATEWADTEPGVPAGSMAESMQAESAATETSILDTGMPAGSAQRDLPLPEPAAEESALPSPEAIAGEHLAASETDAGAWAVGGNAEAAVAPPPSGPLLPLPDLSARPPRRWPWWLGAVVAMTALVFQAALHFRVELAALYPQARPLLLSLAGIAGKKLDLPMKIALVGIETSDLHPAPGNANRLQLAATLRNRAPFAQAWPHLELTLTDAADRALLRRTLAPADYLPTDTDANGGFPANGEFAVQLDLQPTGVTAAGYRLYVFYP